MSLVCVPIGEYVKAEVKKVYSTQVVDASEEAEDAGGADATSKLTKKEVRTCLSLM